MGAHVNATKSSSTFGMKGQCMSKQKRIEIDQKRSEYERKLLRLGNDLRMLQWSYVKTERELKDKAARYEQKLARLGDTSTR